jgi:DNA-directed RNA polymerase specialized sigma24 family protein
VKTVVNWSSTGWLPVVPSVRRQDQFGGVTVTRERRFLDRLYEAHGPALLGFVTSAVSGDQQTAEDIVQEIMIKT